jgi:hypothetical protein
VDGVSVLLTDAHSGALDLQDDVGLKQNRAAQLKAARVDLVGDQTVNPPLPGKQQLYEAAKAAKVDATAEKTATDSNAKTYIAKVINRMKSILGQEWTSAWEALGFAGGSIAMPATADARFAILPSIATYFTNNAANEDPTLGITAAAAAALHTALTTARAASLASNTAAGEAKAARDASLAAARKRLTGLRDELAQLIAGDDPRWYSFGFNRPDDPETPQVVEHLTLTAGAPGSRVIYADWDDARRADLYRIFAKWGTMTEPVHIGDAYDSDGEVNGVANNIPSGTVVEVTIVSHNDAGDAQASAPVSISMP